MSPTNRASRHHRRGICHGSPSFPPANAERRSFRLSKSFVGQITFARRGFGNNTTERLHGTSPCCGKLEPRRGNVCGINADSECCVRAEFYVWLVGVEIMAGATQCHYWIDKLLSESNRTFSPPYDMYPRVSAFGSSESGRVV